jgi:hypothetical protein
VKGPIDRDRQGVARVAHAALMTIQIACPWCEEELAFAVDESSDELVCSGCAMRMQFAPDPQVTYSLLYATAA